MLRGMCKARAIPSSCFLGVYGHRCKKWETHSARSEPCLFIRFIIHSCARKLESPCSTIKCKRGAFGQRKALVALPVDLEPREIVQHTRKEQEGVAGKSKFLWKKIRLQGRTHNPPVISIIDDNPPPSLGIKEVLNQIP